MIKTLFGSAILFSFLLLLASCVATDTAKKKSTMDSAPHVTIDINTIEDAVPQRVVRTKAGNMKSYVVFGKTYQVMKSSDGYVQEGTASWYGQKFHGRKTSNGERFDMYAMTAAHKTLPIPTYAEITNLSNNKTVIVRINDRGPFHGERLIDLSWAGAEKLGYAGNGTANVRIRALDTENPLNDLREQSGVQTKSVEQYEKKPNKTLSNEQKPSVEAAVVDQISTKISNNYYRAGAFESLLQAQDYVRLLRLHSTYAVKMLEIQEGGITQFIVVMGPLDEYANEPTLNMVMDLMGFPQGKLITIDQNTIVQE